MDASLNINAVAHCRSIRVATIGLALVVAGLAAPCATLADDTPFRPPTASERSIALIESKESSTVSDPADVQEAPAGVGVDWTSVRPGQTANARSIALIEGRDPANFPMVTSEAPDDPVITHRPDSWDE